MERPKDFLALPAFADKKMYHVHLWKKVEYAGRVWNASMQDIRIRGEVAKKIIDSIYTAEELKRRPSEQPASQE